MNDNKVEDIRVQIKMNQRWGRIAILGSIGKSDLRGGNIFNSYLKKRVHYNQFYETQSIWDPNQN